MGLGGISLWQLLIILVIVLLIFGTKKMRNLGGDLGGAIKGFKNAMKDEEKSVEISATEETDCTQEGETKATKTKDKQP